jgi:hypothetical protein
VGDDKLFVDYAGDTVPVIVDRLTGEVPAANLRGAFFRRPAAASEFLNALKLKDISVSGVGPGASAQNPRARRCCDGGDASPTVTASQLASQKIHLILAINSARIFENVYFGLHGRFAR